MLCAVLAGTQTNAFIVFWSEGCFRKGRSVCARIHLAQRIPVDFLADEHPVPWARVGVRRIRTTANARAFSSCRYWSCSGNSRVHKKQLEQKNAAPKGRRFSLYNLLVGAFFFIGVAGVCVGIIAGSLYSLSWPVILFFFLIGGTCTLFACIQKKRVFALLALCFVCISLGTVRMLMVERALPEAFASRLNTKVSVVGTVVLDPDVRESTQRLTVETEKDGEKTRVLVIAAPYPEVRFGERVEAKGVLVRPEAFEAAGGRMFPYDTFLEKDGVFSILEFASIESVEPRSGVYAHARGMLSDIKFFGIHALQNALPEPHASLASGLILGGKQGLGKELIDDFITTGLIHIVVLSGYNVMIVAESVFRLFGVFSRRFASAAAAFTIGMFVLVAGAGAASVRAGTMAGIALYARATGRTYNALRALVGAGLLMVLWNPLILLYDPGFQLSAIATLGLIFGTPLVEQKLVRIRVTFVRELVAATIAAQAAVLPLLLYQNGLFSLVSIPANLLVLLLVPLSMCMSFIGLVGGALFPSIAPIFGFPAYLLLSYIISVVEMLASFSFSSFIIPSFSFVFVLLSYALLSFVVWKATPRHARNAPRTHPM